jgi:glucose/arabinose dehydrogenase
MKKALLTLLTAFALSASAQTPAETTQKNAAPDTTVTITPPAAQQAQSDTLRLDPGIESVFKNMGLELRTIMHVSPEGVNFFIHPDDALRMPDNIIMAVFQDKPEEALPKGNNQLLVPEDLIHKGDTATAVAKIFRADCSVIFFKNDGSNKLTKENMLGYSIVEEAEISAKSPVTGALRSVLIMPDRKYSAWFTSDGTQTEVSKPRVEKQKKEPRQERVTLNTW